MKNIIIEVPYVVEALVVPPRKRKPISINIIRSVFVNLRVRDPSEMPIAFLYMDNQATLQYGTYEEKDAEFLKVAQEIRWDGVRLLSSSKKTGDRLRVSEISAELALMRDTPFSFKQKSKPLYHWIKPITGEIEGRIIQDNEVEVRAGVIAVSLDIFFCDGHFWEECPEPVWVATEDYGYHRVEAALADTAVLSSRKKIFSADRMEDAVQSLKEKPLIKNIHTDIYTRGMIRVLIPAAMQLTLDDQNLIMTVKIVLESQKKSLHEKPKAFMNTYADLRDALAGIDTHDPMSSVTPKFIEAIANMVREWPVLDYTSISLDRDMLVVAMERLVQRRNIIDAPSLPRP